MEQIQTVEASQKKGLAISAPKKVAGVVLFLILFQGIILFGPQFLGNWAHDNFHSYRHSVGMACH
jgi:hypothetical protein